MAKKVAVIGAGPGGLYAAKEAAGLGLNVTLFDKGKIGENIVCAEGFFDLLKILPPPVAGICFPVEEIVFSVIDTFLVDCSQLHIWMIDRSKWQKALKAEAAALGCKIEEQLSIGPKEFRQLEKEFDWIIDATGVQCLSSSIYHLPPVRTAPTIQYTLEGDFTSFIGKIKAVADPRYCGYAWIFPQNAYVANVGLGWFGKREKGLQLRNELHSFLQREGLAHYDVVKRVGGPIPVARRQKIVFNKTLLIGDAAGLSSPLHGGGIDTACISGILAARAIAQQQPQHYAAAVEKIIGAKLNLEEKILKVWEYADFAAFNKLCALSFGQKETTFLQKMLLSLTQEAAILQYVQSGKLRADWQRGLVLDDLPFIAKKIMQKLMKTAP